MKKVIQGWDCLESGDVPGWAAPGPFLSVGCGDDVMLAVVFSLEAHWGL